MMGQGNLRFRSASESESEGGGEGSFGLLVPWSLVAHSPALHSSANGLFVRVSAENLTGPQPYRALQHGVDSRRWLMSLRSVRGSTGFCPRSGPWQCVNYVVRFNCLRYNGLRRRLAGVLESRNSV
jgi:hypothetical protein